MNCKIGINSIRNHRSIMKTRGNYFKKYFRTPYKSQKYSKGRNLEDFYFDEN